jgi:peptidoglycan/LPS O-acetylase OafA/YrhL
MSDNQRIRHIDAWRFIAVSLVICTHIVAHSNLKFLAETIPFIWRLGRFGELGVRIFFFISGFVICRGLAQESLASNFVSLKAFYVRRFFRILPPLWLYLAFVALMSVAGVITIALPKIGNSALFLCNFYSIDGCPWYVGHTWSLAYEEQFYFLFPVLFVVFGFTIRPVLLLFLLSLMVSASLGFRWLDFVGPADYLSVMSFLLYGCAAALYWNRCAPIFRNVKVTTWVMALVLLVILVGGLPLEAQAYVGPLFYPLLIGLLVLGTPVSNIKIRAFFHHRFAVYLGKISYTVYLWQQLATGNYPTLSVWWTVLFVVGVWLFAHGSYRYFERPLIGVAARWSDSIKRRDAAVRGVGGNP